MLSPTVKHLKKISTYFLILLAAILITSFSIDAADTLTGRGGTMLASIMGTKNDLCPEGMLHLPTGLTFTCVDEYEASASKDCQIGEPKSQQDTEINLIKSSCIPTNAEGKKPWTYVDRQQASALCARAGKRLPSASEWYQFSIDTKADKCNTSSSDLESGQLDSECISAWGVKNTVGNAWEWVSDDVINGVYQNRDLPITGYVKEVDSAGVATVTTEGQQTDGISDYFWSNKEGSYAVIRGGFYGSKTDAGVYTFHAQTLSSFAGAAVGFRCVR